MKITKKHIDAALALASGTETDEQLALCEATSDSVVIPAYDGCINILAAAYRKLLEKNQEQKKYILELKEKLDGWTSPY
jgi:hypothetical protein